LGSYSLWARSKTFWQAILPGIKPWANPRLYEKNSSRVSMWL
jgi:hypothetical protein